MYSEKIKIKDWHERLEDAKKWIKVSDEEKRILSMSEHYFTTFYINTKKRTKCFVLYNKFLTTKIQRKKMTLYVKLIIQRKNCYWKTATIFFTLF